MHVEPWLGTREYVTVTNKTENFPTSWSLPLTRGLGHKHAQLYN